MRATGRSRTRAAPVMRWTPSVRDATRMLVPDDALAVHDGCVDLGLDVLHELIEGDRALERGLEVLDPARREGLLTEVRVELQNKVGVGQLALEHLLRLFLEGGLLRHLLVERLGAGNAPAALGTVERGLPTHVLLEHRPRGVGVLGLRGYDPPGRGHRRITADARPGRRGQEDG